MKNIKLSILITSLIILFVNCGNLTNSEIDSFIALIRIDYDKEDENLNIQVNNISDPIFDTKQIKINGNSIEFFSRKTSSIYYSYGSITKEALSGNIDNLNIKIKSENGELSGHIERPDSVIITSIPDSIDINEDILIEWSGNADYYYFSYFFRYIDQDGNINFYDDDIYKITGKNAVIAHENVKKDGLLSILIIPINGPLSKEKAKGNLNGDGGGYLYYWGNPTYIDIPIGNGLETNATESKSFDINTLKKRIEKQYIDELKNANS